MALVLRQPLVDGLEDLRREGGREGGRERGKLEMNFELTNFC